MNTIDNLKLTVTILLLLILGQAVAQEERDEATEVWIAVEAQWDADEKDDQEVDQQYAGRRILRMG